LKPKPDKPRRTDWKRQITNKFQLSKRKKIPNLMLNTKKSAFKTTKADSQVWNFVF